MPYDRWHAVQWSIRLRDHPAGCVRDAETELVFQILPDRAEPLLVSDAEFPALGTHCTEARRLPNQMSKAPLNPSRYNPPCTVRQGPNLYAHMHADPFGLLDPVDSSDGHLESGEYGGCYCLLHSLEPELGPIELT